MIYLGFATKTLLEEGDLFLQHVKYIRLNIFLAKNALVTFMPILKISHNLKYVTTITSS